jgi:CBS domain-containing protein
MAGQGTVDIKLNIHSDLVEHAKAAEPLVVPPHTTVREVLSTLQLHNAGSLLICEGNKLIGIFTERDALRLMATSADLDVPIRDVMTKNPVTISRDAPIAEAVKLMSAGGYRRLPIVDHDGSLAGVVKVSGILHYFVDHFPETVLNLPPKPNVIMPEREGA